MNNRFEFEIRQSILISNQSLLRNLPGRVKPYEDSVESDHAVGIFILSVRFAVKLNRCEKKSREKCFRCYANKNLITKRFHVMWDK